MSNDPKKSRTDSRKADTFVLRLEGGMRPKVESVSKDKRQSMNSWILEAIDEKLARAERQELLLSSLEKALNGELVITGATQSVETMVEKLKKAMPASKVLQ